MLPIARRNRFTKHAFQCVGCGMACDGFVPVVRIHGLDAAINVLSKRKQLRLYIIRQRAAIFANFKRFAEADGLATLGSINFD